MNPQDDVKDINRVLPDDALTAETEEIALLEYIARRVLDGDEPIFMNEDMASALEQTYAPIEVTDELRDKLQARIQQALSDSDFEQEMTRLRRRPTLGGYLFFLRSRARWSSTDAANEVGIDPHVMTELERDQLSAKRIPARPLTKLIRQLRGSLEQTLTLLPGLVKERPCLLAGARGSLFRNAPGANRHQSEASSLAARGVSGQRVENPKYREEVEAVRRLSDEVAAFWRRPDDLAE